MKRLLHLPLLLLLLPLTAGAQTRMNGPWTAGTGLGVTGSTVTVPASIPAPVRVFVATTGNDANTCLTVAVPCATLTRALTAGTAMLNSNGQSLYIKMAAGSYTQSFFVSGPLTGGINSAPNPNGTNAQPGQVVVEGDGSATTTLTGSASYCGTIVASNFANVAVRALRLVGNGVACQSSLFAQMSGMFHGLDDIDFGPASVEHIHLENGGQFQGWYSYKVSGSAVAHVTSGQAANYIHNAFPSGVITFVGTPTFTYFAFATQTGNIQWNAGVTWSGSFIGQRYLVINNGTIQTNPSTSLTWLPGTIAGYANSGGVYQGPFSVNIVGAIASDGAGGFTRAVCGDIDNLQCGNVAWTPVLRFGGLTTGITYSSQVGFYSQYNKIITAAFDITLSSKGSATGIAGIAGFPFTTHNSMTHPCAIGFYSGAVGIANWAGSYMNNASVVLELGTSNTTGVLPYNDTNFTNTTRISGRCTYAAN